MKRFVTEYNTAERLFSGHIDALDAEHAQALCDERGRGERVLGVLMLVIEDNPHLTPEKVTELMQALADSDDQEPPDAEEFERRPETRDTAGPAA